MGFLQPFSFSENKLVAFCLGGRAKNCNIELHDVIFLVGKNSEELIPQIKEKWFGTLQTLHVDSWFAVENVEGHDVVLSKEPSSQDGTNLYFVNLGAYKNNVFGELHYMKFVAAKSVLEAKNRAKSDLENDLVELHTDDVYDVDDCIELKEVAGFHIHLKPGTKTNSPPVNGWQRVK